MYWAPEALRVLVLIAAVAFVSTATYDNPKPFYDNKCLLCICKTLGDGDCQSGGECRSRDCFGPFRITKQYWITAGTPVQPGDNSLLPGAFRRCVEEPFCAVRTIQAQMSPGMLKDFDRDGRISCIDLYIAHMYGRNYEKALDLSSGSFPYLKTCLNWTEQRQNVAPPKPPTSSHVGPRGASIGSSSLRRTSGTSELTAAESRGSASFNEGHSNGITGRGNINNSPRPPNGSHSPRLPNGSSSRNTPMQTQRGYDRNNPMQTGGEYFSSSRSQRGW